MHASDNGTRRRFFVAWLYGLWGLIGATLGLPALVYLLLPPKAKDEAEWVEIGELERLPANAPEEVVFRRHRKDGWKVISEKTTAWVRKVSESEVLAFAPICTHLGCAYHWDEQKQNFLCPCHTSTFGLEGQVLAGPAPRPLDRYLVRIEGGKVKLGPVEISRQES
jgi:menaquinol-cytochrome c reductase iron-sulfur subunit